MLRGVALGLVLANLALLLWGSGRPDPAPTAVAGPPIADDVRRLRLLGEVPPPPAMPDCFWLGPDLNDCVAPLHSIESPPPDSPTPESGQVLPP